MAESTMNTTSLSMGGNPGIGTNRSLSMTGQTISTAIARQNLQLMKKQDRRVQRLYNDVYNLVSSMSGQEKVAILREYGELDQLRSTSKQELNIKTTECIIIHMSDKEIDALLAQIRFKNDRVKRLIITSNDRLGKVTSSAAKSLANQKKLFGFNSSTFQKTFDSIKKYSAKGAVQAAKRIDPSYQIGKRYKSKYAKLYKELMREVLPYYNKIELVGLATRMGIEVYDGKKEKRLREEIATKIVLYVHLIVGKSKKANLGGTILDPSAYNEILKLTSYAYVTGEPGTSGTEFAEMRKRMQDAKKMIQVRMKAQQKIKRTDMLGSKRYVKKLRGGALEQRLDSDDAYLREMAEGLGIKTQRRTRKAIKEEILRTIAAQEKAAINYEAKARRGRKSLYRKTELLGKSNMVANESTLRLIELMNNQESTEGGIPLVRLDKTGESIEANINSAVPVIIVGNIRGGINKENAEKLTKIMKQRNGRLEDDADDITGYGLSENKAFGKNVKAWKYKRYRIRSLETAGRQDAILNRLGLPDTFDYRKLMDGTTTDQIGTKDNYLGIPKINYNITMADDELKKAAVEVLPVFVVNMIKGIGEQRK